MVIAPTDPLFGSRLQWKQEEPREGIDFPGTTPGSLGLFRPASRPPARGAVHNLFVPFPPLCIFICVYTNTNTNRYKCAYYAMTVYS